MFFEGISKCFEIEVNGGIYTKSGGARVRFLGNVGLKKIRFSE